MAQSTITTGKEARTSRVSFEQSRTMYAWFFLVPTLFIIAVIAIYPLFQTFWLSFTSTRINVDRPASFVGFDNFINLFGDSDFQSALVITLAFTVITVFFEFVLGMVVALVLNANFRGRGVMRAVMLIPWALPTVISTKIWAWMYNDNYGVFTDMFRRIGIIKPNDNFAFLSTTNGTPFAMGIVSVIDIWKTTPYMALLLLAGLQLVPDDIYEAARVDGANRIQQFFQITLPLLRPSIAVALIFRTLDAVRVFDLFYALFGDRPDVQTVATFAQNKLVNQSRVGYGSAVCVILFIIIAIFVAVYVRTFKIEEA
ncbi:MAG TPA: sugar ABC transporter permease [Chloroflexia bacterium]|nr:sugar ABC transporter permease [Chloroflexia bacterium]